MPDVEISLVHWPGGSTGGPVLIAKTANPETLRLVRDQIIREARDRAGIAHALDPVQAELGEERAERIQRTLQLLIPDPPSRPEVSEPALRLIRPGSKETDGGEVQ